MNARRQCTCQPIGRRLHQRHIPADATRQVRHEVWHPALHVRQRTGIRHGEVQEVPDCACYRRCRVFHLVDGSADTGSNVAHQIGAPGSCRGDHTADSRFCVGESVCNRILNAGRLAADGGDNALEGRRDRSAQTAHRVGDRSFHIRPGGRHAGLQTIHRRGDCRLQAVPCRGNAGFQRIDRADDAGFQGVPCADDRGFQAVHGAGHRGFQPVPRGRDTGLQAVDRCGDRTFQACPCRRDRRFQAGHRRRD